MNANHQTAVPPGQVVIDEIGLSATVLGLQTEFPTLSKSTVWRWSQPRAVGGTDGIVPARYHRPLLRLAQRMGRNLSPDDLVHGRSAD